VFLECRKLKNGTLVHVHGWRSRCARDQTAVGLSAVYKAGIVPVEGRYEKPLVPQLHAVLRAQFVQNLAKLCLIIDLHCWKSGIAAEILGECGAAR
jgi:hypothetical protein